MCYNAKITTAFVVLTTLQLARNFADPRKHKYLVTHVFFYLMEVLQLCGYIWPKASWIAYALYLHVAFQPFFYLRLFLTDKNRHFRLPLLGASFLAGALYAMKALTLSSKDNNFVFGGDKAECILPPETVHVTWQAPLGSNYFEYFTPNIHFHFIFFFAIPVFLEPMRALATFTIGPLLSLCLDAIITGRFRYSVLAEASMAATWCIQTIITLMI